MVSPEMRTSRSVPARAQRRLRPALLTGAAAVGLAVAAAVSAPAGAQTLPTGAQVVSGQAAFTADGLNLNVRQSTPAAIISWETFSIGQPNGVHVDNGAGATLNRVRGNVASQIDGSLTATGSLYLVNPAGIAVGSTGRVATGGSFIGSTLELSDDEFAKAARGESYTLRGDSSASVVNAGRIGSLGGDVALVARTVENMGDIDAPGGTAALVAGTEVLVQDRALDGGRFVVKAGGSGTSVRNSGNIKAAEVELRANGGNVYALAGNRSGVVAATGVARRGGRVFLTAGDAGTVVVSQPIAARRANAGGGDIRVSGRRVKVASTLDASGRAPGVLPPARPSRFDGDGGTVIVTGEAITLADAARLDVSGTMGGVALIGGDFQGGKDAANNYVAEKVATAKTLTVTEGATIAADGAGDGGRIVLWSDERTAFAGRVSATSGTGRGGDAEVSGKAWLGFTGAADLTGPAGAGTLLLDPYNLEIKNVGSNVDISGAGTSADPYASAAGDTSILSVATLIAALGTADVTVKTGGSAAGDGNITVTDALSWSSGKTLTLDAYGTIAINAPITATVGGLTLRAKARDVANLTTATITASAAVDVGTFFLEAGAWVQNSAALPGFEARDFRYAGGEAQSGNGAVSSVTFMRVTGGAGTSASPWTIADLYGLQGMATTPNNNNAYHYNLTANIDASSTANWYGGAGFSPIGTAVSGYNFIGGVDGKGHVITNLTINRPAQNNVGLFGGVSYTSYYGSPIKNIGLENVSIKGNGNVGSLTGQTSSSYNSTTNVWATGAVTGVGSNVGGLIGYGTGGNSVTSAWTTVEVVGGSSVGGLVGNYFSAGLISSSFATGSVTSISGTAGGLVGYSYGNIADSYATGAVTAGGGAVGGLVGSMNSGTSISRSYATGAVTIAGVTGMAGGLVGSAANTGGITNVYATGAVTALAAFDQASKIRVGGLIGEVSGNTSISNASASGRVTAWSGNSYVGGLIGRRSASGNITGAFWDEGSTGQAAAMRDDNGTGTLSITPVTAADAYTQSTYAGFDFTNTWYSVDGQMRPLLRMTLDKFYDASTKTYTIGSAEGLQLIRQQTDAGTTSNKTYKLVSDVAFSATSDSSAWRTENRKSGSDYGFLSIGTSANPFAGTFDGLGRVIRQMTISRPGQGSVGLFGTASAAATIRNVGLEGGHVIGAVATGALAGWMDGAILNAFSTVKVDGTLNTGGLVGSLGGSVTNAWASGEVSAPGGSVGGLVGLMNGSLTNVYATGKVTGPYLIGGLVGLQGGNITNAYSTATVIGGSTAGGLVGKQHGGSITNAWASGNVTASSVGGLVQARSTTAGDIVASFWDSSTTSAATLGVASDERAGAGVDLTQLTTATAYSRATYDFSNFDANWYIVDGETRPMLRMALEQIGARRDALGSVVPGTYTIHTPEQLQLVRAHADAGATAGKTYRLGSDIDFGAAFSAASVWRSATTADSGGYYGFLPIGTDAANAAFNGRFDGGGHVVKGLVIHRPGEANTGLFGYASSATIENIGVDNIQVAGGDATGGLIGSASGGTVSNVHAAGSVTGASTTGGLIGWAGSTAIANAWSTGTVTATGDEIGGLVGGQSMDGGSITNAWARVNVTGNRYVGGLVGAQNMATGTISIAYAAGNVQGNSHVGGLVGLGDGSITNAYATGAVTGASHVGGLLGAGKAVIANAYATGLVTGTANAGGLVGFRTGTGDITASFWDKTSTGLDAGIGLDDGSGARTITGLTTAQLNDTTYFIGLTKSNGWNFDTVWAPPGGGYAPELYALSKVVRLQSNAVLTQQYGGGNGSWTTAHASYTVYGSGQNISGDLFNVGAAKAFDWATIDPAAVTVPFLNASSGHVAGAHFVADDGDGWRVVYTSGLTIAKKTIDLTGFTGGLVLGKVYDGTTTVTINTADNLIAGITGETLNLVLATSSYNNANAGDRTITGTWNIASVTGGSALASNYTLTGKSLSANAVIAQKSIDVAGLSATGLTTVRVYDGTTTVGGTGTRTKAGISGETLNLKLTGVSFDDANAGSRTITGTWSINTVTGGKATAANYILTGTDFSTTGTIDKRSISVSGLSATGLTTVRDYDGTTAVSGSGTNTKAGATGETLNLVLTGLAYSDANAGSRSIAGTWSLGSVTGGKADANNYTLTGTGFSTAGTISKVAIDVSGLTAAGLTTVRDYDGTTAVSGTATSTRAGVTGETLNLTLTGLAYSDANAGSRSIAGTWSLGSVTGGKANVSNYTLTGAGFSTTGTIDKKTIDVSGLTATGLTTTREYDGTTAVSGSGATTKAGVTGETLSLALTGVAYSDANAGNRTIAGTWSLDGVTGGKANADNYTLTGTGFSTAGTIGKKTVDLTGFIGGVVLGKVYDGTTAVTSNAADNVIAGVTGETLNLNLASFFYSDANAGQRTITGTWSLGGVSGGRANADNYTLTGAGLSADAVIAPKEIDVSAVVGNISGLATTRDYDGTTAVGGAGTGTIAGVLGETLNLTLAGLAYNDPNAGSRTIAGTWSLGSVTGGAADAGNYTLTGAGFSTAGTIGKKTIDLSGLAASGFTTIRDYDGTTAVSGNGAATTVGVVGETLNLALAGLAYSDPNAGSRTITGTWSLGSVTGGAADADNYTLTGTGFSAAGSISRKAIDLSGFAGAQAAGTFDRIYDATGSFDHGAFALATGVNSETLSLTLDAAYDAAGAGARRLIGTWKGASGTGLSSNYVLTQIDVNIATTITKAQLTVTARNQQITEGDAEPPLAYDVDATQWKGADGSSLFAGALARVAGPDAGDYTITRGTLTAGDNYEINFTGATLRIVPASTSGGGNDGGNSGEGDGKGNDSGSNAGAGNGGGDAGSGTGGSGNGAGSSLTDADTDTDTVADAGGAGASAGAGNTIPAIEPGRGRLGATIQTLGFSVDVIRGLSPVIQAQIIEDAPQADAASRQAAQQMSDSVMADTPTLAACASGSGARGRGVYLAGGGGSANQDALRIARFVFAAESLDVAAAFAPGNDGPALQYRAGIVVPAAVTCAPT